jgi:hypothetical protein
MQDFRKPNVKATRFRFKKCKVVDDKFLKDLREKHPETKKYSKQDVNRIVALFNQKLWEGALEFRDGIELPESLGYIFIGACPRVFKENIDYGKSIKYGVKVTHKNWETDGHVGKIFFSNYYAKYKLKERSIWGFTATRDFKRTTTRVFKEDWKKYVIVEKTITISKLYKKMIRKDLGKKLESIRLKEYDEFDMN